MPRAVKTPCPSVLRLREPPWWGCSQVDGKDAVDLTPLARGGGIPTATEKPFPSLSAVSALWGYAGRAPVLDLHLCRLHGLRSGRSPRCHYSCGLLPRGGSYLVRKVSSTSLRFSVNADLNVTPPSVLTPPEHLPLSAKEKRVSKKPL